MASQIAPWLEGLGEAWEVPPQHNIPKTISSASHDASSLRSTASRLPRRSLSGLASLHSNSTTQTSLLRQRNALAPVSGNDAHTAKHKHNDKSSIRLSSVLRYSNVSSLNEGTVQLRSKSSSPVKKQETMEWKQRLLGRGRGYGDQTELFGPSGLENIFSPPKAQEKPTPLPEPRNTDRQPTEETPMRSSPPPWSPKSHVQDQARENCEPAVSVYSALAHDSSLVSDPFDLDMSQSSTRHEQTTTSKPHSGREIGKQQNENESFRTLGGETELDQESFSPVFITKHASGNGQVEYAALDSRVLRETIRAQQSPDRYSDHSETHVDETFADEALPSQALEDLSDIDSTIDAPEISFSENLPTGSPLPDLGRHVELHRGGYSQHGSFKQRLLSPSQSLLDGTSAVRSTQRSITLRTRDDAAVDNNGSAANVGPRHRPELPIRSPNSPLKLFGNHDTFTNDRLMRRLSQLDSHDTKAQSAQKLIESIDVLQMNASQHLEANADEHSIFGSGDLDSHAFHAEPSMSTPPEPLGIQNNSSPASNVSIPGQKSPVGFRTSSYVGKQYESMRSRSGSYRISSLSRMKSSATQDNETWSNLISARMGLGCESNALADDHGACRGKRPPESPQKRRNSKRRRTLQSTEFNNAPLDSGHSEQSSIRLSSSGRKRKDARPGMMQNVADPDVLLQRKILVPTNLSSCQRSRSQIQADLREAAEEFAVQQPERLEAVIEQIESSMTADGTPTLQQQAESVATEVAAFTLNVRKPADEEGVRKRSVTTQDFLNEAMMVMKLIRAKARPQSNLGSVEENSASNSPTDDENVEKSSLRLSRPPSREGSGWRPRNPPQISGARVASQLRKFQERDEQDDTDFIANSIASLQIEDDVLANDQVVVVDEHSKIRITGPLPVVKETDYDQDFRSGSQQLHATVCTHSTQGSMETSTGRTINTTSTRKSENLGTLAPDTVAHLIGDQVGGMTFDKEKQSWVRISKSPPKKSNSFLELPSTATSDDDPFREISDLPVDEQTELRRISSPGKVTQAQAIASAMLDPTLSRKDSANTYSASSTEEANVPNKMSSSRPVTRDGNPSIDHLNSSSAPSRYSALASSQNEKVETRATSWSDEELHKLSTMAKARHSVQIQPSLGAVIEIREEIEDLSNCDPAAISVAPESSDGGDDGFSSEVHDNSQPQHVDIDSDAYPRPSGNRLPNHGSNSRYISSHNTVPRTATRQVSLRRQTLQNRFASEIFEQNEVSFVAPLPGDRMISLSLSVARPINQRLQTDVAELSSSPSKTCSSFLLSDLPDFTVHELDEERPSEKALAMRLAQHAAMETNDRYALAVKNLVKILTDVVGDDLYWEHLRTLDLQHRDLELLYELDYFCPRVSELNISNNSIAHLQGAPCSILKLIATSNKLKSLTPWAHLRNLQYLDVSNNQLEDLNGLSTLFHLRELRADNNGISDLKAIFNLDGLLKLRLRQNKIKRVDFDGCRLQGLTDLDLSDNALTALASCDQLPALQTLGLDNNKLVEGLPIRSTMEHLGVISARNCGMRSLDVSSLPELRILDVDDNCLPSIQGLELLKPLDVLSMRRQSLSDGQRFTVFEGRIRAQTLNLSGNVLHPMQVASNNFSVEHLEMVSCGIQRLPPDFGLRLPNLQTLDLSFNSVKDIRPLLNIDGLQWLSLQGNRVERLRKTVATLSKLTKLAHVDLRDTILTQHFYPPPCPTVCNNCDKSIVPVLPKLPLADHEEEEYTISQRGKRTPPALSAVCPDHDREHCLRLDEDTKLRRRVYELLLANSCPSLGTVDGLEFDKQKPLVKDCVWTKLLELGVIKKSEI